MNLAKIFLDTILNKVCFLTFLFLTRINSTVTDKYLKLILFPLGRMVVTGYFKLSWIKTLRE